MASNLKIMHLDHCTLNLFIPSAKYTAVQTYENYHEGLLSFKKNIIISNAARCKLGCARKIPIGIYSK
ncbi:Dicer-like protein 2 [Datura stramonium]|uniref:Dicer-like protein 2 n=1 Tax=Datura stramonium TaxID=4076 RepID=A0ABS8SV43_DATST|nr:Dicer-like protein 2 [Datura stramonium]